MSESAPLMVSVSGCRGVVGASMTPEVAARFAGAYAGWLRERSKQAGVAVVLGRDGRAGGHVIRDAAAAGLMAAGCRVIDLGVAMTPTVGFMVDELGADGGLVITASHNPQQWNGLKPILGGNTLGEAGVWASAPPKAIAEQIVARFHEGRVALAEWNGVGRAEANGTAAQGHVSRVLGEVASATGGLEPIQQRRFRVVLDSVNGSGRIGGRMLLEELGCDAVFAADADTGIFEHEPEPIEKNLGGLCQSVKDFHADIGFAQDPDADRLAVVDDRGVFIGEEYTLVLAAMALLSGAGLGGAGRGGVVVVNLSTSRMIEDVAAGFGMSVMRTPVGEANVVEAMKHQGAVLGGEGNGGVIWPAVTYIRDSLGAMGLVLALMAQTGKKLSELVAQVPRYAIEKRKVELRDQSQAARAVEAVAKAYAGKGEVDRQDGVRVDFADKRAWLHVRASNTEPIMRLIAEAPELAMARGILDDAAKVIG